jgi:hypothetical protein
MVDIAAEFPYACKRKKNFFYSISTNSQSLVILLASCGSPPNLRAACEMALASSPNLFPIVNPAAATYQYMPDPVRPFLFQKCNNIASEAIACG